MELHHNCRLCAFFSLLSWDCSLFVDCALALPTVLVLVVVFSFPTCGGEVLSVAVMIVVFAATVHHAAV